MRNQSLSWIAALACFAGCAEAPMGSAKTAARYYAESATAPAAARLAVTTTERGNLEAVGQERNRAAVADPNARAAPPVARKILYTADVALLVEDFPKAADSIAELVRRSGGYVADTDASGSPGQNRAATWKVRVPVDGFDSFLNDLVKLGELERKKMSSQDVTEEFFDLEARVKNKKVEEARLVKHLTESTGKLEDILAVEREISRVREEVERMEGRVRMLANLAALTTVNISVHERKGYVPATAPTFGTRASRRLADSTKQLTDTLQGVALALLSILPWLPVWIVLGLLVWFFRRTLRRLARWASTPLGPRRPAAP